MRWFKHMTASADDEKLSRLKDEYGLEGYGFWWSVVEIIAANLDENEQTSVEFSAKKWGNSLGISPKKFRMIAGFCANLGLFSVKISGNYIAIDMPNILKFRDEYSERKAKKSGQHRDNVPTSRARVSDTDTDTDTEYSPLTPQGETGKANPELPPSAPLQEKLPAPPLPVRPADAAMPEHVPEPAMPPAPSEPEYVPDMEFTQLRADWNEHMRPEGPKAGSKAYLALKKARAWPGISAIRGDIAKRRELCVWNPGFEPGLDKYLSERTWLAPMPQARASPQRPLTFEEAEEERRQRRRQAAMEYDRQQEAVHENAGV